MRMRYETHKSVGYVEKLIGRTLDFQDQLLNYDEFNHRGCSTELCTINTKHSEFKIRAMVETHYESDVMGGVSTSSNSYIIFAEQFCRNKQMTKVVKRKRTQSWAFENSSTTNQYDLVNLY